MDSSGKRSLHQLFEAAGNHSGYPREQEISLVAVTDNTTVVAYVNHQVGNSFPGPHGSDMQTLQTSPRAGYVNLSLAYSGTVQQDSRPPIHDPPGHSNRVDTEPRGAWFHSCSTCGDVLTTQVSAADVWQSIPGPVAGPG